MKEKCAHDLFCVLIFFPRHLPSEPKGLGKVFRERKNNEFPKYLTEIMKGELEGMSVKTWAPLTGMQPGFRVTTYNVITFHSVPYRLPEYVAHK